MKTQDTQKWRNVVIAVAALLAVLFPILGHAGPMGNAGPLVEAGCMQLNLSDFLAAQGTSTLFFPPVKDYVGWDDGNGGMTFALVDYAGLANASIEAQTGDPLGTVVGGSVIASERADGTAQITVALSTTGALGFAQSIKALRKNHFDFLNTPTIFGAKVQDVVNGTDPAVGPATLSTAFIIEPDAGLPDLVDVLVNNPAQYAPVTLSYTSTTFGTCADGREARLDVHQEASTHSNGKLVFSVEIVAAVDTNGHSCGE